MNYSYVRVSTINQHLDRQIDELNKAGLLNSQIFIDKKSEKYFNRTNYKKTPEKIRSGDVLYVNLIGLLVITIWFWTNENPY